jgi:hypothetical protein
MGIPVLLGPVRFAGGVAVVQVSSLTTQTIEQSWKYQSYPDRFSNRGQDNLNPGDEAAGHLRHKGSACQ